MTIREEWEKYREHGIPAWASSDPRCLRLAYQAFVAGAMTCLKGLAIEGADPDELGVDLLELALEIVEEERAREGGP